jgi:hypothetical protein
MYRHPGRLLCVFHDAAFMALSLRSKSLSADDELRDEGGLELGLVAAAKKEQAETHGIRVAPPLK